MVQEQKFTYANAEGDTVTVSPHEHATRYRNRGYVRVDTTTEEEPQVPSLQQPEEEEVPQAQVEAPVRRPRDQKG